jgi:integrase
MARKTLTDRLLKMKTLKTGTADSIVPELAVRIGAAGQRTFILIKRFPGRRNPTRRRLGQYPAISLEQAREKARRWIALIQRGIDPTIEVAAEREANLVRQQTTCGVVFESFLTKHAASRRTAGAIGRLVRGKLISRWRDQPIENIGLSDIVNMIEDVQEKSGVEMARQTYAYARKIWKWAVARGLITTNPFATITIADFLPKKTSRDRVLTDSELALVLKATADDGGVGYPTSEYTRFVLMTACRRGEAADAVWPEFDLAQGTWLLPASRVKNASEHALPLPAAVIDILKALPRFVGSDYVFSDTAGRRPISGFSTRKIKLDQRIAELNGGKPILPYTWHHLRRSAASGMAALGIAPHVIESILNHRSGVISGVARIYLRHDFRAEKLHALTVWAQHLHHLEHGDDVGNVVRLRQ